MSGLVFSGPTTNNFGEFLPAPYIEKIYVSETGFTVQIALHINTMSADPDIDAIHANLARLTYYVIPVWQESAHKILENYKNEDIFTLFPQNGLESNYVPFQNSLIFDQVTLGSQRWFFEAEFSEVSETCCHGDFEIDPGPYYDDQGNVILKYIITKETASGQQVAGASSGASARLLEGAGMPFVSKKFIYWSDALPYYSTEAPGYSFQNLKIIAFSSPIEVELPWYHHGPGILHNIDGSTTELPRTKTKTITYFPSICGVDAYQSVEGEAGTDGWGHGSGAGEAFREDFFEFTGVGGQLREHWAGYEEGSPYGWTIDVDTGERVPITTGDIRGFARDQILLELQVFESDHVVGVLSPSTDPMILKAVISDYFSGGGVSSMLTAAGFEADVEDKCLSAFETEYEQYFPLYEWDFERYGDKSIHAIDGSEFLASEHIDVRKAEQWVAPAFDTLTPQMINKYTSDISVETVITNGLVSASPSTIYIKEDGSICSQEYIQALDGRYYEGATITISEITAEFIKLIDEEQYTTRVNKNRSLANAISDISYVLSVHGTEYNILAKLNQLRYAFPDKSTATMTGHLYERFRRRLYNANLKVRDNAVLERKIIQNNKIVDVSFVAEDAYQPPMDNSGLVGYLDYSPYLYSEDYLIGRRHVVGSEQITIGGDDSGYTVGDDHVLRSSGYFFFDFKKVLYYETNLSKLLSIGKLDTLFGPAFAQHMLKYDQINLERRFITEPFFDLSIDARDSATVMKRFEVNYDRSFSHKYPVIGEAGLRQLTNVDYPDAGYEERDTVNWTGASWGSGTGTLATDYSYVYLRALGGIGASASQIGNEYRLAAIEFQDYYNMFSSAFMVDADLNDGREFYRAEVEMYDGTHKVYESLQYHFYITLDTLKDYLDMAKENCSYNQNSTVFNKFFADGSHGRWGGPNILSAPWIRAPLLLQLHRDLLFNTYHGDKEKIIVAAQKLSNNVNPDSGNLPDLQHFYDSMKHMYDNFYDPDQAHEHSGFGVLGWSATPKNILAELDNLGQLNAELSFSTDLINLPPIADMIDSAGYTDIDDSLAWVRADISEYFELKGGGVIDSGAFGVTYETDGAVWPMTGWPTTSPAHGTSQIFDFIQALGFDSFFKSDTAGEDLTQHWYRDYCLGDLWTLLVVWAAENGVPESACIQLMVYDSPFYADMKGDPSDPTTSYSGVTIDRSMPIPDWVAGVSSMSILTGFDKLASIASMLNMTNNFAPQNSKAHYTGYGADAAGLTEIFAAVRNYAPNECPGTCYKWWENGGAEAVWTTATELNDVQKAAITKLIARTPTQLLIYADAISHIYNNYSITGNQIQINDTRGGCPRSAYDREVIIGGDISDWKGFKRLRYTGGAYGAGDDLWDSAFDRYSGVGEFSGMNFQGLVELAGGEGY